MEHYMERIERGLILVGVIMALFLVASLLAAFN
jgi:hypothetical protein